VLNFDPALEQSRVIGKLIPAAFKIVAMIMPWEKARRNAV
jgi:hypothetical protein